MITSIVFFLRWIDTSVIESSVNEAENDDIISKNDLMPKSQNQRCEKIARMHVNDEYNDSNASKSATYFQTFWFSSKLCNINNIAPYTRLE